MFTRLIATLSPDTGKSTQVNLHIRDIENNETEKGAKACRNYTLNPQHPPRLWIDLAIQIYSAQAHETYCLTEATRGARSQILSEGGCQSSSSKS